MNSKLKTILNILEKSAIALPTRDIYAKMEPAEQCMHGSTEVLSKYLCQIRLRKSYVENGEPETIKGKTMFTWKITKSGSKLLEEQTESAITNTNETVVDKVFDEMSSIDEFIPIIEITDPLAFFDSATDSVRELIEQLLKKEPPKIVNKEEMLSVLKHFNDFSEPMNANFARVLTNIGAVIEKLEEA